MFPRVLGQREFQFPVYLPGFPEPSAERGPEEAQEQVEISARYEGYIKKQEEQLPKNILNPNGLYSGMRFDQGF